MDALAASTADPWNHSSRTAGSAARRASPNATTLMMTADAGGSKGYRNNLWKVELAKLAAETGLAMTVGPGEMGLRFPPAR